MTSWQKINYWSEIRLNFFTIATATVERVSQSIHGVSCERAHWSVIPEWHGHSWKSPGTQLENAELFRRKAWRKQNTAGSSCSSTALLLQDMGKAKNRPWGEVWTARTWRSKRRYRAKQEVMKADFSSLGADTVFRGEADTKAAITVTRMNLGGESITRQGGHHCYSRGKEDIWDWKETRVMFSVS